MLVRLDHTMTMLVRLDQLVLDHTMTVSQVRPIGVRPYYVSQVRPLGVRPYYDHVSQVRP
jgi:hypothetical protein